MQAPGREGLAPAFRVGQLAVGLAHAFFEGRGEAEIDVGRLEMLGLAAQVPKQRAQGGLDRGLGQFPAGGQPGAELESEPQPAGRRFHVAFHAGDLAGQIHPRARQEFQALAQHPGRVDEGVAVDAAQARELGRVQGRDHAKDPLLFPVGELGLEAHQIERGAVHVFRPQLHHGIGPPARARVGQADRLHGAKGQGALASLGHGFDRQAALEMEFLFKGPTRHLARFEQGGHESLVRGLVQGAVAIVPFPFLPARGPERLLHVHRRGGDDGRDGVVEIEAVLPHGLGQAHGHPVRGQGAGRHHHGLETGQTRIGQAHDLPAHQRHEGFVFDPGSHGRGKMFAVHGQGLAGRHLGVPGDGDDGAAQFRHLDLEQAHGRDRLVGTQGIGAHELGQQRTDMGRRIGLRLHFEQGRGDPEPGQGQGALAPGQAAADDGYGHGQYSFATVKRPGQGEKVQPEAVRTVRTAPVCYGRVPRMSSPDSGCPSRRCAGRRGPYRRPGRRSGYRGTWT